MIRFPTKNITFAGPSEYEMMQWSRESGVSLDTLDSTKKYYLFDIPTETFNLVTEPTIAPNTFYLAVSVDVFAGQETDVPSSIKLDLNAEVVLPEEDPDGIAATKAVKTATKGIHTLDGRRIGTISRDGIYIFNGKKVVYRKK